MTEIREYQTLISVEELSAYLENKALKVLDCRFQLSDRDWGQQQFVTGHIPGAIYVHLDHDLSGHVIAGKTGRHPLPSAERFAGRLGQWGITPGDQVVCYDQGPGGIAARAWWLMRWVGHTRVAVLDGGMALWQEAGFHVSTRIDIPRPVNYPFTGVHMPTINADQLNYWRTSEQHVVIDARIHERYLGVTEPIDPVAGHIPGAVNMPFPENLDQNGAWKSSEELRQRYAPLLDHGPGAAACYCGSGVTACHNILAIKHAGFGDATLYPGSWSAWITDPERPVSAG